MALTVCFMSCSKNSPDGVVKEYYAAFQAKDYDKALECLYFKKDLTPEQKDQFKTLIAEVSKEADKKGGIKTVDITETEMAADESSAVVSVTITYGDGTTHSEKNKVVKVDDKWLVDSGK